MFTGLVEEVGTVASIIENGGNHRITIKAPYSAKELREGNSIAVSGVCLTALDIKTDTFCCRLSEGDLDADFVLAHDRGGRGQS